MEYRKLGQSGLKVSELCLGTMQFGWTTDIGRYGQQIRLQHDAQQCAWNGSLDAVLECFAKIGSRDICVVHREQIACFVVA